MTYQQSNGKAVAYISTNFGCTINEIRQSQRKANRRARPRGENYVSSSEVRTKIIQSHTTNYISQNSNQERTYKKPERTEYNTPEVPKLWGAHRAEGMLILRGGGS
jgi:hypothetical protein